MAENNELVETLERPDIPEFEVKGPKKERKGSGFPWFPNLTALQGQSVGVHMLALASSKFGMIAALGSIALGSAAVGVTIRNDDMANKATNARSLTKDMRQTSAASLAANQAALAGDASNSMDGMAYISGGAGGGQGIDGAGASASVAQADGAAAGGAAGDGSGAAGGEGANGAAGANSADAIAAAMAGAAAGQGAAARTAGKGQLAKMAGFGGSSSGGGGGGGGVPIASLMGKTSGIREGVDATVRQGIVGKAGRERLVAGGRRTSGALRSESLKKLSGMAPTMSANRTGTEGALSTHSGAWEAAKPTGQTVSGPGALGPTPGGGPTTGAGISTGEGGPVNMGGGGSGVSNVPEIPGFKNVTPYQWAVDIGKIIMLLIMVLSIVSAIAKKWPNVMSPAILKMVYTITAALGAILALLGVYMLAMGQVVQGAIWTIVGGAAAIIALSNMDDTATTSDKALADKAAAEAAKAQAPLANGASAAPVSGAAPVTGGVAPVTGGVAPVTGGVAPVTGGVAPVTGGVAPVIGTGAAPVTSAAVTGAVAPAAEVAATSFGAGNLIGAGLGVVGFGTANMANTADTKDFKNTEKENYKKKYGIDPDTNRVINHAKFDAKYGKGAAERWEREHQDLD